MKLTPQIIKTSNPGHSIVVLHKDGEKGIPCFQQQMPTEIANYLNALIFKDNHPQPANPMAFQRIELSADEYAEVLRYHTFGEDWQIKALDSKRVRKYIAAFLDTVEQKSGNPRGWNCYSEGANVFKRKDGLPITQDDVDALHNYVLGQGNTITVAADKLTVTQEWFCDSSD